MSQPLGITKAEERAYVEYLHGPHDFEIDVDVLNMEERPLTSIRPQFKDGQVNIQRDGRIKASATFTFHDPEHSLHFDSDSPFAGAVFANRMIRFAYIVNVPGVGRVRVVAFVGPVATANREGDDLTVECHDKARLAVEGCPPKKVKKGRNAVDAIEDIMRDRTGERRFRFPKGSKKRLKKTYNVGWKAESAPWEVCQKIAASIDMQLLYSSDGALVLRRKPKSPTLDLTGLTGPLRSEFDITSVRNYVRVTGEKKVKGGAEAPKKIKHENFTVDAEAPRQHKLSPQQIGRHGVKRYLPLLIDDSSIKKQKTAQDRADRELGDSLPMAIRASFSGIPFFHLDYSDIIKAHTDYGVLNLPFVEGSIPLGLGGDAEYGTQRVVSKPRRTR